MFVAVFTQVITDPCVNLGGNVCAFFVWCAVKLLYIKTED